VLPAVSESINVITGCELLIMLGLEYQVCKQPRCVHGEFHFNQLIGCFIIGGVYMAELLYQIAAQPATVVSACVAVHLLLFII